MFVNDGFIVGERRYLYEFAEKDIWVMYGGTFFLLCKSAAVGAQELQEGDYTKYDCIISKNNDFEREEAAYSAVPNAGETDSALRNFRAFQVLENNKVLVMDAGQKEIFLFENGILENKIDISYCIDPHYFVFENDLLIIFDLTSYGKLYYVNMLGEVVKEIEFPEELLPYTISGFYYYEGEYYLLSYDKELISPDTFMIVKPLFEI